MTDPFSRSKDTSKLDLRLGDPVFLQTYWDQEALDIVDFYKIPNNDMGYAHTEPSEILKQAIFNLHEAAGRYYEGRHIVIGAGATQILMAAFQTEPFILSVKPPHYPRFKNMASLASVPFAYSNLNPSLVTAPNNPDGEVDMELVKKASIIDACYDWPTYYRGHKQPKIDGPILVHSLAKATGHASTRIGWALVKDKARAEAMQHYIELTTGGISVDAQDMAISIINTLLDEIDNNNIFTFGSDELQCRWASLKEIGVPVKPTDRGMFLFLNDPDHKIESLGILGIRGERFGVSNTYIRLNMGCSIEDFDKLLNLMRDIF